MQKLAPEMEVKHKGSTRFDLIVLQYLNEHGGKASWLHAVATLIPNWHSLQHISFMGSLIINFRVTLAQAAYRSDNPTVPMRITVAGSNPATAH